MHPADAARMVAESLMSRCRLQRDEAKSTLLYELSDAFYVFAELYAGRGVGGVNHDSPGDYVAGAVC